MGNAPAVPLKSHQLMRKKIHRLRRQMCKMWQPCATRRGSYRCPKAPSNMCPRLTGWHAMVSVNSCDLLERSSLYGSHPVHIDHQTLPGCSYSRDQTNGTNYAHLVTLFTLSHARLIVGNSKVHVLLVVVRILICLTYPHQAW